jgi:hypothetical protein
MPHAPFALVLALAPVPPTQAALADLLRTSWLQAEARRAAADGLSALARRDWGGAWRANQAIWGEMSEGFRTGRSSPVIQIRVEGQDASDPDPQIDVWIWRLEMARLALLIASPGEAERLVQEVRQGSKVHGGAASRTLADVWTRQGRYGEALAMAMSASVLRSGEEELLTLAASSNPIARMQLEDLAAQRASGSGGGALPDPSKASSGPIWPVAEARLILAEQAWRAGRLAEAKDRLRRVLEVGGDEAYWHRVIALAIRTRIDSRSNGGN